MRKQNIIQLNHTKDDAGIDCMELVIMDVNFSVLYKGIMGMREYGNLIGSAYKFCDINNTVEGDNYVGLTE